jgi:hypothetical protein
MRLNRKLLFHILLWEQKIFFEVNSMRTENGSNSPLAKYSNSESIKHCPTKSPGVSINTVFPGLVHLAPFYSITLNGDYEANGIGLGLGLPGTINIPILPSGSSIIAAFLFWTARRYGNETPIYPNGYFKGQFITGTLIGTATLEEGVFADGFYADVSLLASDGGNEVGGFFGENSFTDGASLVVIYSNPNLPLKTVVINDGLVAFLDDTVFTTLQNFTAGNSPITAKTTYMAGLTSEGQDNAFFNGATVGTGVFNYKLGDYWNNVTVDVSTLVNPGDTSAEAGIFNGPIEVLVWVVQAFSVNAPVVPTRGINIFSDKGTADCVKLCDFTFSK